MYSSMVTCSPLLGRSGGTAGGAAVGARVGEPRALADTGTVTLGAVPAVAAEEHHRLWRETEVAVMDVEKHYLSLLLL